MNSYFIVLSIAVLFSEPGFGYKFPDSFKRCKVSPELDGKPNECLVVAMNEAIHQLAENGNSDLGATDLDPLLIKHMIIDHGGDRPVAIKLEFTNNNITGFSTLEAKSVSGKLSSPKDFHMVIKFAIKTLKLVGPYKINGKVLILPIQGTGTSTMILTGVTATITIKGQPQIKDGKESLKITSFDLKFRPKKLHYDFGNLFNGDKALGDNTNLFLNQNWEDIFNELKKAIETAFGEVYRDYTKQILENLPFNEIFLLD